MAADRSSGGTAKMGGRRIRFAPVAMTDTGEAVKTQFRTSWAYTKKVYINIVKDLNRWEWATLALLSTSTIFFFVAFLTNGWGTILVRIKAGATGNLNSSMGGYNPPILRLQDKGYETTEGEYWEFGLWQCCRNDGFCLGPRFAMVYGAARASAVLALFGHVVTLAWFIGHSVEKIVRCDICAYCCLTGFCWTTAVFVLICVCFFGIRWPIDFAHEFHGTDVYLDYSFYLAVVCLFLVTAAGVTILIHMMKLYNYLQSLQPENFLTAEELLGKDEEGNIQYV